MGPTQGRQLDLFDPPLDGWWEVEVGSSRVWVRAGSAAEARERAVYELRDLGVLPGGPPGLNESYLRMRDHALGGAADSPDPRAP